MSKQSDIVKVSQDAGTTGFVNITGDTMTGGLFAPYQVIEGDIPYVGATIRNTRTDTSVSFIDAQNRTTAADSHIFFQHNTDGSSLISFGTQPAGDFTDRRVNGRMIIDGNGRVTMPYQPRCIVSQNGGWRTLTAGTAYGVSDGAFLLNNGGFYIGGQINGFNAVHVPVSGWYRFDMYVYSGNGTPAGARLILMKNNVEEIVFVQNPSATDSTNFISRMFYMTANDYVNYRVAPPAFPNFTAYFTNNHTMLAIKLEG
jgi:hypothetical protein